MSSDSDIDVMSCDYNSNFFDDDVCDIDVVAASAADNNSTDDTSHQAESDHANRTNRSKQRKQLLTERPASADFSEVSLCTSCHLIAIYF